MIRTTLTAALAAAALAAPSVHAATLLETFDGDTITTTDLTITSRDGEAFTTIVSQGAGDDALDIRATQNQGDVVRAITVDTTAVQTFSVSSDVVFTRQNFTASFSGLIAGGDSSFGGDGYRLQVFQAANGQTSYTLRILDGGAEIASTSIANPQGTSSNLSLTGLIDAAGDLQLVGTSGTNSVTATVAAADVSFGTGVYGIESGSIFSNNTYQAQFDNVAVNVTAVPEPGSLALAAAGLGLVAMRRRRSA